MTEFGDSEPEDAWHPDDPPRILLDNLRRRISLLRASFDPVATARERLRFDQLDEDLAHVIEQVQDRG